jgi:hypothetical protein
MSVDKGTSHGTVHPWMTAHEKRKLRRGRAIQPGLGMLGAVESCLLGTDSEGVYSQSRIQCLVCSNSLHLYHSISFPAPLLGYLGHSQSSTKVLVLPHNVFSRSRTTTSHWGSNRWTCQAHWNRRRRCGRISWTPKAAQGRTRLSTSFSIRRFSARRTIEPASHSTLNLR